MNDFHSHSEWIYKKGRLAPQIESAVKTFPVVVISGARQVGKSTSFGDAKNLISFIEDNPETTRGILIHAGGSVKWLHSKVLAVPWWWIC